MNWIANNWFLIIVGVALCYFLISIGIWFWRLPEEQKIANIKEWLKYAVVEAEKALGSGTGQIKLRMVYDLACKQFPWILKTVSFDVFSVWVDEALTWMKEQLDQNKAIETLVKG